MNVDLVLVFRCGDARLAVPVGELVAVAPAKITPLPLAEAAHLGITDHQGSLYPVFDPLVLFGEGEGPAEPPLLLLLEVEGHALALTCDQVEGSGPAEAPEPPENRSGLPEVEVLGRRALRPDLAGAVRRRLPAP